GQSGQTTVTPTLVNGSYQVVFTQDNDDGVVTGLADGTYDYTLRYKSGGQVLREARGQFTPAASGSSSATLQFTRAGGAPIEKRVNTFAYDRAGRLASSTDPRGFSETYGYDALGNRTSFTNKKGSVWTYAYDAAGRLTDEFDPPVAVTSAAGAVESAVVLRTH